MSKKVKVNLLTKKDLREAVLNSTYWGPEKNAPISKNRASWIESSPRLNDKDYCLLIGLEDDKMIAFVYMLPDLLNDVERTRVYWMIEWWVVPEYQNSVLSTYIFTEGLRLAGNNILIKFYAEHIKPFYDKQPFTELHSRIRHTVFFGLNPDLITRKIKLTKYVKPLVNCGDSIVSYAYRKINKRIAYKVGADLQFEYFNEIDSVSAKWILEHCKDDIISKTKDYINWQLSPEQYITTPIFDNVYEKVQLRDYAAVIGLYNFTVIQNKKIIGFISFSNHGGEVYLKYFISAANYMNQNISALMQHLVKLKISHIFTDNEEVGKLVKDFYKTTFVHKVKKVALMNNALIDKTKGLVLKEQDGNFY